MVNQGCPGQDGRNLKASLHRCSNCGYMVEIFSDKKRIKCLKCKEYVYNKSFASCKNGAYKLKSAKNIDANFYII